MGKKLTIDERRQIDKERRFKAANRSINTYVIFAIILSGAILLFFFVNWACIYNTDIRGNEVQFSGYNALFAALSGKYTEANSLYGDIAIPFYYYAQEYVQRLAVMTIVVFFITVANIGVQIFALVKEKHFLNFISSGFSLIQCVVFYICFSVALSMKDSQILPIYCSGNAACSIKSYIILPAIAAFVSMVITIFACIKYIKAKKILN